MNNHPAGVAELADAQDLKSCGGYTPCRFDSGPRHSLKNYFTRYLWIACFFMHTFKKGCWKIFHNLFFYLLLYFSAIDLAKKRRKNGNTTRIISAVFILLGKTPVKNKMDNTTTTVINIA